MPVPNFPVVMFSTDAGAFLERRGLTIMVNWSTCPVRIAPFQDRLFANIISIAPSTTIPFDLRHNSSFGTVSALSPTIPFRPVRVPNFPVVMFSTDAGAF